MPKLNIGDRVRFLNSVGEGEIREIKSDGVILVRDESGFDIPVQAREVVVVAEGSTLIPKSISFAGSDRSSTETSTATKTEQRTPPSTPIQPDRKRPEVSGQEPLSCYLAYLPEDITRLGATPYEVYLVNDSNYDLQLFYYWGASPKEMVLHYQGVVPFDSSELIDVFDPKEAPTRSYTQIQTIAFKPEGTGTPKSPYDLTVRVNGARLFKKNAFRENDFFDDDAIVIDLVVNDVPATQTYQTGSEEIEKAILTKKGQDQRKRPQRPDKHRKQDSKQPRVVDLHINELVDTTAGMDNKAMLELQTEKVRQVMREEKNHRGSKVIFIHGKGEGVLRKEVYNVIRKEYPKAVLQDASFQEYGFGATQVTIY